MNYDNLSQELESNGFVLLKNFFSIQEANKIIGFKEKLQQLEESPGKWMIYYEESNGEQLRCRVENFIYYDTEIKNFLDTKIMPLLTGIFKTEMNIFKDKINWKMPNGNGFQAHQDHPAWNDLPPKIFYSVALFGNNSTIENGCLQMVKSKNKEGLYNNDVNNSGGCIPKEIEETFDWEYVESSPRDLLIFDSFAPHRSSPNNTTSSRSIFYFTFNKAIEGNYYTQYFENKRKYFPPPNERNNEDINIENNRYNLANPIK